MTPPTDTPRQYVVPTPDGKTATLIRTWTDAQVRTIIADALAVVEELQPDEDLRATVFATALNLGGQMAPKQSGITIAPPMSAIENGKV